MKFLTYEEGIDYFDSQLPPPNYQKLKGYFPEADFYNKGTIFTYGKTIHSRFAYPTHTLIHEMVHVKQQSIMGPKIWWWLYVRSKWFRLRQELQAYRTEYNFIVVSGNDYSYILRKLDFFALHLSTMYGLDISYTKAEELIRNK